MPFDDDGNGLSPRVRGNRCRRAVYRVRRGSIPARAGEPLRKSAGSQVARVYPRACGGTSSPVRSGNDRRVYPRACGEPDGPRLACATGRVYPRACGGTVASCRKPVMGTGLSPRVRGNPHRTCLASEGIGSIPARAGEPHRPRRLYRLPWVYPRACGGTREVVVRSVSVAGLSPRVRGNRPDDDGERADSGSIPARAGEPPGP